MFRFLCTFCFPLILLSSCTDVLSSNFPGKAETAIPSNWKGQYILQLPPALSELEEEDKNKKQYVTIQQDKIIWDHFSRLSVYSLKDSLVISSIKDEKYISTKNSEGFYTVFRVKEDGKDLHLFGMYIEKEVKKSDLEPYFKNVKEENAASLYKVTIIDNKLKDYFQSSLVTQKPIILIRQ